VPFFIRNYTKPKAGIGPFMPITNPLVDWKSLIGFNSLSIWRLAPEFKLILLVLELPLSILLLKFWFLHRLVVAQLFDICKHLNFRNLCSCILFTCRCIGSSTVLILKDSFSLYQGYISCTAHLVEL
jgi:hypothetical protein